MDHPVVNDLLEELGQPLISCTLILPGEEFPVTDAEDIRAQLEKQVDLIIDGGHCGIEPTTVIRLTDSVPDIRRHGKGKNHGL
jgi:tRNA A37 threonylcarbamoyladenosine synthetase subunit TsaC/SUA5/YrdC